MKKLLLVLAILLAGCAQTPPKIVYVPQEVKVPVPVKCTPPQIDKPVLTFDQANKNNLLYNNLGLLGAENQNLSAYTIQLEAALKGCTQ